MKRIFIIVLAIFSLCAVPCYGDLFIIGYDYDLGPFRYFNGSTADDLVNKFPDVPKWVYNIYTKNEYKKHVEESAYFVEEYPTYEAWKEGSTNYNYNYTMTSYRKFNKEVKQMTIWAVTYGCFLVFWIGVLRVVVCKIKGKKLEEKREGNSNTYNIEPNKNYTSSVETANKKKNQYFNDED